LTEKIQAEKIQAENFLLAEKSLLAWNFLLAEKIQAEFSIG
jgi:hypothetical protein